MEEEDQKMNHGRYLDGYMRSRVILNSSKTNFETYPNVKNGDFLGKLEIDDDADQYAAYGLRQNPKKTWRLVSSKNVDLHQEENSRECGKLKALCGHMVCHSEKLKSSNSVEDDSKSDSASETETGFSRRKRRSGRIKDKTLIIDDYSSSGSEIEREQEEVAMCLIMLSRDYSGNWGGFNSFIGSSDNNSVVFEAKSLSSDMKFSMENGKKIVHNVDKSAEMKKKPRGKKVNFGDFNSHLLNSESGHFNDGSKKIESEDCATGSFKNGELEITSTDFEKDTKRHKKYTKNESLRGLITEEAYNHATEANGTFDVEMCKKRARKISSCSVNDKKVFGKGEKKSAFKKGKKHECQVCLKVFKSGQALGGHKRIHIPLVIHESPQNVVNLIDLNLPPPIEDGNKWALLNHGS